MGDIGDRHNQAVAGARRLSEHRIVEVARIRTVDGDERDVAQILAPLRADAARSFRFGQHLGGEGVGDVERRDHQQADRARAARIAQALGDAHRL